MFRLFITITGFLITLNSYSQSSLELYPDLSDEDQVRFIELTNDLRCPKCQSSSLSGSNAPIAIDLKNVIYGLIKEGKSDNFIKAFLKKRYGEYILYNPPLIFSTWILWYGPFLFFFLVLFVILMNIKSNNKVSK